MRTHNFILLLIVGLFSINPLHAQQKNPTLTIPDSCLATDSDTLVIQQTGYVRQIEFSDFRSEQYSKWYKVRLHVFEIGKRDVVTKFVTTNRYQILGVCIDHGIPDPNRFAIHRYVCVKLTCEKLRADILAELNRRDKAVIFSW